MYTPMMQQYLAVKEEYKDAIVFFRLGDFYEMFFDDAKTVSREIGLTLTGRDCGREERAPMCGVPYHSADAYIAKLVRLGHKIVICEQVEDPASAQGLVKRDVTRIITPGTVTEDTMLTETKNNYLCAVYLDEGEAGLTFADVSTGDLYNTRISGEALIQKVLNELSVYDPAEVVLNVSKRSDNALYDYFFTRPSCMINDNADWRFDMITAEQAILTQFSGTPDKMGLQFESQIRSVGAMLGYISETQRTTVSYIKNLNVYSDDEYLEIDMNSRRSLELTETMRNKEFKGSLLWVLDRTHSAMGARVLRKWTEQPLISMNEINARLDAVEALYEDAITRGEIIENMKNVRDLERLMTRIAYGTANPKDLRAMSSTLAVVPIIQELLRDNPCSVLRELAEDMGNTDDIVDLINRAIKVDPPFSVREGGFIEKGYNEMVDDLVDILEHGKDYIKTIESREREATGISKLKVGYNKVFGYYIEVTKSGLDSVPDTYIRKQTLVNCERFITDELKDLEANILGASDKDGKLEYELFCQITDYIKESRERVQQAANALATVDAICSLADVAFKNGYVRPEVDYGDVIDIRDGKHPVVEKFSKDSYFVPNDTYLDTGRNRLALITGPNMAGKSTYMRQTAIICIMAQIGSFVPASSARIGIVDKIFTRVGASDDLASGQSTFMLEMNEVAYILRNATKRSLIIYDEIGRGTSTYDGMSIARAVAEYTCEKVGAKTLFATHYHELTDLEAECEGIINYNIAAKKKKDDILFLRKIVRGATDDSYGIEVAKLAGVPSPVIQRAKNVLEGIINGEHGLRVPVAAVSFNQSDNVTFDDYRLEEIRSKLMQTEPETLTPIEAMNLVYELKKMLD